MIAFEIEPNQEQYLLQEKVVLKLRLVNSGPDPVQVPDPTAASNGQPIYTMHVKGSAGVPAVTEADAAEGDDPEEEDAEAVEVDSTVTFTNFTRRGQGEPPPVQTLTISPGQTWTGEVVLNDIVEVEAAGEYQLESVLAYQGGTSGAPQTTFRVGQADPISIHVSQGERPFGAAQGMITFLQRSGKDSVGVFSSLFKENEPHNREVRVRPVTRVATAGPTALGIVTPWLNGGPFSTLLQWSIWHEGKTLKLLNTAASKPVSFELPQAPDRLVRPALQTEKGPVEVLALKGKSISLVSFVSNLAAKASVAWTADLPAVPSEITAILGPPETGSLRHIAFAVRHPDHIEVFHGQFTTSGLSEFASVQIGDGTLLEQTSIALAATSDGISHVALARKSQDGSKLDLVRIKFADGAKPQVDVRPLPKLEKPVLGGAIALVTAKGALIRTDLAVLSGEDIWGLSQSGDWKTVNPRRTFPQPVTLVPGRDLSYVLCFDHNGAIHLQPLER